MEKIHSILIIDDDDINNFLFSRMINSAGIAENVTSVLSAREGLDYLKQAAVGDKPLPDIIFLDINMPVMNGWDFLEEYKKLPKGIREQINLFVLSSSVYQDDINKAKSYEEVVDYISKPLSKQNLIELGKKHFN